MDRFRTEMYFTLQKIANRVPYCVARRLRYLSHCIRPPLPRMVAVMRPTGGRPRI